MATINLSTITSMLPTEGQALATILLPYIPVLMRESEDFFSQFVAAFNKQDYETITQLTYSKMTLTERKVLEDATYTALRNDAIQRYKDIQSDKQLAMSASLSIIIALLKVIPL